MSTYITGNFFLNQSQMEQNARFIWEYLAPRGWTLNAVAGMLGNMQTESTLNPGIWENCEEGNTSGGYGLVQWTPATKYLEWCSANNKVAQNMESALDRIEWELANAVQFYATDEYPLTFKQFKVSTQSPEYLAQAFLRNYERPKNPDQPFRSTQARAWFDFLSTFVPPVNPDQPDNPSTPNEAKKMSLILMYMATKG